MNRSRGWTFWRGTLVAAVTAVSVTFAFAAPAPALAAPGSVLAWGADNTGQLGDGAAGGPEECEDLYRGQPCSRLPLPVSGLSTVTSVAAGGADTESGEYSLALLSNGTVMAWGANGSGQLGDGSEGGSSGVPVPVSGLSGVIAIAAGEANSLALLNNGTVMTWGANDSGQLGDGSEGSSSDVPVPVSGLSNVTAIAAGQSYDLALQSNGFVRAWGANSVGQLGDNREGGSSDMPVYVKELSGATAIAAGGSHSLALLENGTVVTWGNNYPGQLEFNCCFKLRTDVPIPVSELEGVTAIATGGESNSLALLGNGTLMAWGNNLGDGSEVGKSDAPVAVKGLSGVTAIAAGEGHSLALLSNGTVTAWGGNGAGQLGDGSSDGSDVPIAVSGLGGVGAIAAGGLHSLAVSALPTVTAVQPNSGPVTGGTTVSITGVNFTGATAVSFGSAKARFRINSATSITATSPPGAGTVGVSVTTSAGTSPARAGGDAFSYEPTVTGLQPNSGPPSGGTLVRITGSNLTGATAVMFGARKASRIAVLSASSILASSPAGTGTVNVSVTTTGGTSQLGTDDLFSYATPGEWTIFPTPGLDSPSGALDGVSCVSFRFCVAVGSDSHPGSEGLIEDWDGTAWSQIPAPAPEAKEWREGLSDVSCASPSFCVAVGTAFLAKNATPDSGGPFAVLNSWNGVTWSDVKPEIGNKGELSGVSCVSSRFCVAVGSKIHNLFGGSVPVGLAWNGETWSRTAVVEPKLAYPAEYAELTDVSCTSPKFCMAIGAVEGSTLIESWNGTEWSIVPSPKGGIALSSVACTSEQHCVAVGSGVTASGPGHALVESWNGSSWSVLEPPAPEESTLKAVSCESSSFCVAVGARGAEGDRQTLVETFQGGKWAIVPSADGAAGSTHLDGVSCASFLSLLHSCTAVGSVEATSSGPAQTLVEDSGLFF